MISGIRACWRTGLLEYLRSHRRPALCHAQGVLTKPKEEAVSHAEMVEACFRHLQREHRGTPRPGPYYSSYLRWLKQGLPPWQAYTERSALHALANCYLQARGWGTLMALAYSPATTPPRDVHGWYRRIMPCDSNLGDLGSVGTVC